MNVIFFGSSKFILPVIEVLRGNYNLLQVVTTEKNGGAVPSFCEQNKIPCKSVNSLKENIDSVLKIKADIAVVADFGLIIPKKILNAYPKGIINIHPSLLPKYRGPSPVQTAILDGDNLTGVSIMKLDQEIDHGPILGQIQEKILDTDTAETLYESLFDMGADLLIKSLDKYFNKKSEPILQQHKNATFTKILTREDGYINLSTIKTEKEKQKIERMIRAYYPWPGMWTKKTLSGKEKIIKFLPENKIQVEGKKPMTYKDFLNGYPNSENLLKPIF